MRRRLQREDIVRVPFHQNTDVRNQYRIEKEIGKGSYGVVALGTHLNSKQRVAIKIIDKNALASKGELGFARREIEILKDIEHTHIVSVYEVFENHNEISICMELLEGGSIIERIQRMKRPFTGVETKKHLKGIIKAINYLHQRKIAHRDLKPENLMFTSPADDAIIKLIDFGFSKSMRKHGALESPCGSLGYSSKELVVDAIKERKSYTIAVDMFALGCVAYCMIFADPPFVSNCANESQRIAEIDRKVEMGDYDFPSSIPISTEGRDFLQKLLATNPEDRMTATEALQHPWMTNVTIEPDPQSLPPTSSLIEESSVIMCRNSITCTIETFHRKEKERHSQIKLLPPTPPSSPTVLLPFHRSPLPSEWVHRGVDPSTSPLSHSLPSFLSSASASSPSLSPRNLNQGPFSFSEFSDTENDFIRSKDRIDDTYHLARFGRRLHINEDLDNNLEDTNLFPGNDFERNQEHGDSNHESYEFDMVLSFDQEWDGDTKPHRRITDIHKRPVRDGDGSPVKIGMESLRRGKSQPLRTANIKIDDSKEKSHPTHIQNSDRSETLPTSSSLPFPAFLDKFFGPWENTKLYRNRKNRKDPQ